MKTVTINERWLRSAAWTLVCVLVVGGAVGLTGWLFEHGPEADVVSPEPRLQQVRVEEVTVSTVEIAIPANGEVEARRRTVLSAEVGGRLELIDARLEAGQVYESGAVLMRIDGADYEAALAAAEATLAEAELALELEISRKEQALRDWRKLGNVQEPGDLVMRVPHLRSAEAKVEAARAARDQAQRDVERTELKAPYRCRVERTMVDLGAVVTPGLPLVEVMSEGVVEVTFALSLEDHGFLQRDADGNVSGEVTLSASIGGASRTWAGTLVRSEEIVNRETRTIRVVAEFGGEGAEAPPVGMFVKASIAGVSVPGVVKVPRAAMLNGSEVLLVGEDGTLEFRKVTVLRSESDFLLVSSGLQSGDRVVVTPPSVPSPGMKVKVIKEVEAVPAAGEVGWREMDERSGAGKG